MHLVTISVHIGCCVLCHLSAPAFIDPTDLYKKHSPGDVGKVEGLVAKAGGDAKKFAALLSKLVAKFPKVPQLL